MYRFLIVFLYFFSLTAQDKPVVSLGCRECGMFSAWMDVLMALEQYDKGNYDGLEINFAKNGLYYDKSKGDNWWQYYCEPIRLGNIINPISIIGNPPFAPGDIEHYISRKEANLLFNKYITINSEILNDVNKFYEEQLKGYYIITVHYRGTDKYTEVPLVPYGNFATAIWDAYKKSKARYEDVRVFVATDDSNFLNYINSAYWPWIVWQKAERSKNDTPLHLSNPKPYQQGKEALIDALLLSKGNVLIRSSSNLGRWSTYFNPTMEVISLSDR